MRTKVVRGTGRRDASKGARDWASPSLVSRAAGPSRIVFAVAVAVAFGLCLFVGVRHAMDSRRRAPLRLS